MYIYMRKNIFFGIKYKHIKRKPEFIRAVMIWRANRVGIKIYGVFSKKTVVYIQ